MLLHHDGEEGHFRNWVLRGPEGLRTDGSKNRLNLESACTLDSGYIFVSGTDMSSLGYSVPPVESFEAGIANDVINESVFEAEWTDTGTSEQITSKKVNVELGENIRVGAWVYLDSSAGFDLAIRWVGFNTAGATMENSGYNYNSLEPNTWTYITGGGVVGQATTVKSAIYIEAQGNQSAGDKLYVGALHIGEGDDWYYPFTPPTKSLDLRFTAKILGNGPILSNRTALSAGTNGDSFHIEAINEGFTVRVGTSGNDTIINELNYQTPANIYEYGKWYDFRWTYNCDTGDINFYTREKGQWVTIHSGSAGTLSDDFAVALGIEALPGGISSGNCNVILDNFGMFADDNFGWVISEEDDTAEIVGVNMDPDYDQSALSENKSFYLAGSAFVNDVDGVNKEGLQLPYRSELKFGTGDFTIVSSFAAVGDTNDRPLYKDDNIKFGAPSSSGNTEFFVGDETLGLGSNVFDGVTHQVVLEREYGEELRAYIDDMDTATATIADTSFDLNDTSDVNVGFDTYADSDTWLSSAVGVIATFSRLLEEYERDDLYYWLRSGYLIESEPDWLRSSASLYINAHDPVQRAEFAHRQRVINLAVAVPDEIHVRYDFTSDDGASNPVMTGNEVEFRNAHLHAIGAAEDPYAAVSVPSHRLGDNWYDGDWAVLFWAYLDEGTVNRSLIGQGPQGGSGSWDFRLDETDQLELVVGGSSVFTVSKHQPLFEKQCMVVLRKSGDTYTVMVDNQELYEDTNAITFTVDDDSDFKYGMGATGDYGSLYVYDYALSKGQIKSVFLSGSGRPIGVSGDIVTVTDSVSTSSRVWERI